MSGSVPTFLGPVSNTERWNVARDHAVLTGLIRGGVPLRALRAIIPPQPPEGGAIVVWLGC